MVLYQISFCLRFLKWGNIGAEMYSEGPSEQKYATLFEKTCIGPGQVTVARRKFRQCTLHVHCDPGNLSFKNVSRMIF